MVPGGKHAFMGTHNCLLGLGPGFYLEVIAIDRTPRRRPIRAGSTSIISAAHPG